MDAWNTIWFSFWGKRPILGKMVVPLGWYPGCLTPQRALQKKDISTKYPLYKVCVMCMWGWLFRGPHPKGPPSFSLWYLPSSTTKQVRRRRGEALEAPMLDFRPPKFSAYFSRVITPGESLDFRSFTGVISYNYNPINYLGFVFFFRDCLRIVPLYQGIHHHWNLITIWEKYFSFLSLFALKKHIQVLGEKLTCVQMLMYGTFWRDFSQTNSALFGLGIEWPLFLFGCLMNLCQYPVYIPSIRNIYK